MTVSHRCRPQPGVEPKRFIWQVGTAKECKLCPKPTKKAKRRLES